MGKTENDRFRTELLKRIDQRLEHLGMSQSEAEMKAFGSATTIRNWRRKDKSVVPRIDTINMLAPVLKTNLNWLMTGKGSPENVSLTSSFDPDETDPGDNTETQIESNTAAYFDSSLHYKSKADGGIPEIPAAAGAGQGKILDTTEQAYSRGHLATGHPVLNEWVVPEDFIRHGLGGTPRQIVVVPVVGHSMEPRLFAGDRVLCDLAQNSFAGDAIYIITDGDEALKVKTISKITGSMPPRFRIISEAHKEMYDELDHTEFRIVGRVVGRFSRI